MEGGDFDGEHHSTGEFHKLAKTDTQIPGDLDVTPMPVPGDLDITSPLNKVKKSVSGEKQSRNISVFFEESPDVISELPKEFLSDFKGFCWYSSGMELKCLPSVYVAGIPKCGTTEIFDKLTWHPQMVKPGYDKENPYWNRKRLGKPGSFENFGTEGKKQTFQDYLKSFYGSKQQFDHNAMYIDGTPSLLWDLVGWESRYPSYSHPPYTNADLIHAVTPAAKVIVMVRDPVKRLFSDYVYFDAGRSKEEQMMQTPLTFHDDVINEIYWFKKCLKHDSLEICCHSSKNSFKIRLHLGIYVCYVSDWKMIFKGNVMVLTLEEYSKDPVNTLVRAFNFLGVDQPDLKELETFITVTKTRNTNDQAKRYVGGAMDVTVEILRDFYQPYNLELATLLEDSKFLFGWDSV